MSNPADREISGDDYLELCKNFAEITGTDRAMAQFCLQDNSWDLSKALNQYYDTYKSQMQASGAMSSDTYMEISDDDENNTADSSQTLKFVSWNIDGLCEKLRQARTEHAIHEILTESPDVIYLQEVIDSTAAIIKEYLGKYYAIFSGNVDNHSDSYYTLTMVKKKLSTIQSHIIIPFENSVMARNFSITKCVLNDIPLVLINAHLESTKDYSPQRKEQLKLVWNYMLDSAQHGNVLFGGDLNLRDHEINALGGIPEGICDVWEYTGSRKEAGVTWDTKRNINASQLVSAPVKLRFDRFYFISNKSNKNLVKPIYFELLGLTKVPNNQFFASDHWGILAHFDKL